MNISLQGVWRGCLDTASPHYNTVEDSSKYQYKDVDGRNHKIAPESAQQHIDPMTDVRSVRSSSIGKST